MEMLLALLMQSAIAGGGADAARGPQLSYANEAAEAAPRARINQGRSFQIDWSASTPPAVADSRRERRPAAPVRAAPGRTSLWNGAPVRMIDGRPHGLW